MIETSSIIAMTLAGLICTLYPVILLLVWRKKTGASVTPFFVGAGTFILFAMILEQLCHMVFLTGNNPMAQTVRGSAVLYTLYGGFAAGIFEETGRFAAFKFMKKHSGRETAVTYGIGHGGFEAFYLMGISMLTYAAFAALMNRTGSLPALLGDTHGIIAATLRSITPANCAIATYERLVTVLFHTAISVLVFAAARRPGKLWLYPAAILLHACTDFIPVLYQQGIIQSLLLTEGFITVCTALVIVWALRVYRQLRLPAEEVEQA